MKESIQGKFKEINIMYNRPHPGEFIREICFEPLGLTITEAAHKLNVTRKTLSELINGKSGISVEMALRLAKAFNTTAESWLTQQMLYDLWKARQKKVTKLDDIHPFCKKDNVVPTKAYSMKKKTLSLSSKVINSKKLKTVIATDLLKPKSKDNKSSQLKKRA